MQKQGMRRGPRAAVAVMCGVLCSSWLWGQGAYGPRLVHTEAFEQLAWQGLDRMYSMDYAGADSVFAVLDRQHPGHPAPPFVRAANLWWQVAQDLSNASRDAQLLALLETVIARSEAILEKRGADFEADFLLFAALGYKARLLAARNSYWKASNVALRALGPLKRGMKNKKELTEFLFGSGLYNYFVNWYGEYRPIVRPFLAFFPTGDKALGLRELELSASRRNYTQIESAVFLCDIYLDFERAYAQADRFTELLHTRYPRNVQFAYYRARSLYHARQWAAARGLLQPLLEAYPKQEPTKPVSVKGAQVTTQQFAQLTLLRGEIALAEGQHAEALKHLERAQRAIVLTGWSDNEWAARVHLQQGMALDRLGRREEAVRSYRRVADVDNAMKTTRREAEACLQSPCK